MENWFPCEFKSTKYCASENCLYFTLINASLRVCNDQYQRDILIIAINTMFAKLIRMISINTPIHIMHMNEATGWKCRNMNQIICIHRFDMSNESKCTMMLHKIAEERECECEREGWKPREKPRDIW